MAAAAERSPVPARVFASMYGGSPTGRVSPDPVQSIARIDRNEFVNDRMEVPARRVPVREEVSLNTLGSQTGRWTMTDENKGKKMAAFDERFNVRTNLKNPVPNNPYFYEGCNRLYVLQPVFIEHDADTKHEVLPLAGHYTGISGWRNQQPKLSALLNLADACKPHYSCDPQDFVFELSSSDDYYVTQNSQGKLRYTINLLMNSHGVTFQNQAERPLHPALMWLLPLKFFVNGLIGYTPEAQDALNKLMELRKAYNPVNPYSRNNFDSFMQYTTFSGCADNEWGWYSNIASLKVLMVGWFGAEDDAELMEMVNERMYHEIQRLNDLRSGHRAVDGHTLTTVFNPWYFTQASLSNIMSRAIADHHNLELQRKNPAPTNAVNPIKAGMMSAFSGFYDDGTLDVVSKWEEEVYSPILSGRITPPIYRCTLPELNYMLANKLACRHNDCLHTLPLNLLRICASVKDRHAFNEVLNGAFRNTSSVFGLGGDGHGMESAYRTMTGDYQRQLRNAALTYLNDNFGTPTGHNSIPVTDTPKKRADDLFSALDGFGKKLLGKRGFHKDVLERYRALIDIACNQFIANNVWDDIMCNGNMMVFGSCQRGEWFTTLMATAVLTHDYMVNGAPVGIRVTNDGVQFPRVKLILKDGLVVGRKMTYNAPPYLYNTAYGLDMRATIDNMKCRLHKPMFFNVNLDGSDEAYNVVWQVYRVGPHSCMTDFRKENSPLIAYNHCSNDYHIAFTLGSISKSVLLANAEEDASIDVENPLTWTDDVWDNIEVACRALNNKEGYVRAYGDNSDATMRTHGLRHDSDWTEGQVLNAVISWGYEENSDVYRLPYFDSNEYCGFNEDGDLIQGISKRECVDEVVDCTYTSAEVYVPSGKHNPRVLCAHCGERVDEDDMVDAVDSQGYEITICQECARRDYTQITHGVHEDKYMLDERVTECEDGKILPSSEVTYIHQLGEEWWDDDLEECSVTGILYPTIKMTRGVIDDTEIDNLDDDAANALREHYGIEEDEEDE